MIMMSMMIILRTWRLLWHGLSIGTKIGDLEWRIMAVILHYFTEFSSFWGHLHHSGWSQTHTICNRNV